MDHKKTVYIMNELVKTYGEALSEVQERLKKSMKTHMLFNNRAKQAIKDIQQEISERYLVIGMLASELASSLVEEDEVPN